jgi:SNF2 family DNA or RNA helicase
MKSKQKKLINQYEKLPASAKTFVQLMAVYFNEINRTTAVKILSRLGVNDVSGRPIDYKTFKPQLDVLMATGLLGFEPAKNSGPIVVNDELLDYAFQDVFLNGDLQKFLDAIESAFEKKELSRAPWMQARDRGLFRNAFYTGDMKRWNEMLPRMNIQPTLLYPFRTEVFDRLPVVSQAIFSKKVGHELVFGIETGLDAEQRKLVTEALVAATEFDSGALDVLLDLYIAQGNVGVLESLYEKFFVREEIIAAFEFLRGNYDSSLTHFESALKSLRKRVKKRTAIFSNFAGVLYALLLFRKNTVASQAELKRVIKQINEGGNRFFMTAIALEYAFEKAVNPMGEISLPRGFSTEKNPLLIMVSSWVWQWYFKDSKSPFTLKKIQQTSKTFRDSGMNFWNAECDAGASLLSEGADAKTLAKQSAAIHKQCGTVSLIDLIKPDPKWLQALNAIEKIVGASEGSAQTLDADQPLHDERMIWELVVSDDCVTVDPYLQKFGKKGWTKGRKVALSRLHNDRSQFEFLTEQDALICSTLREDVLQNHYGYHERYYNFDSAALAKALVGHPMVFNRGDRTTPVEITKSSPSLTIEKSETQIRFSVTPAATGAPVIIKKESANRIAIFEFTRKQQDLAELVAAMPPIPADQDQRIADVTKAISSVIAVQSDIEAAVEKGSESKPVKSNSNIVVQLTPWQEGLRAELFVRPLGEGGPLCRPGSGANSVFATVEGKPIATRRDLDSEQKNLARLLSLSRQLDARTIGNDQTEWLFHEAEEALELVTELHTIPKKEKVVVLWPRGKTYDVASHATAKQFKLSIKRDKEWFAASGKLKVDDQLTLDMLQLLDLIDESPSRFVKLDDGRFLALSTELRQRIGEIAAYSSTAKNKVRFAPIRALALEELVESTTARTDKHWKEHVARIEESGELKTSPPTTLQAELRDYQQEGFGWLKKLAHWNTGACLADDMGLGKTIQAIALAIDRAKDGPALVVAPASVGFNWESEIHKFAPTLTPKLFRDMDRDQFFKELASGDVAIASYGLVQSEIERFAKIKFNTILLDEAQAIKNMGTKRSQAMMRLQGNFRVILTGTPLENHLGEMWNLFRFITPGLLGNDKEFRQRFAVPIERDQCRESKNRLKKLIQPFLLRRTKTEVLSELPPRTESQIEVELSPAEIAMYEAIRQNALKKLSGATKDDSKKGQQHLQVLAELTRLRLACCHPSLVGGNEIESSKLDLFRQKIREIIDGNHKVLVFSQFVKHLSILRAELDEMGVSYQYLDGSTPTKKRKAIVDSFQSGEGDVFLISLKAGGTGLNLTAADYVIHMDPWWNPAVEDQATDRAHRIGQSRPVNVYRFITKGTIEEKIVALHHAKRDLADSLLDGSNIASKLSTEDLLNLLRDE